MTEGIPDQIGGIKFTRRQGPIPPRPPKDTGWAKLAAYLVEISPDWVEIEDYKGNGTPLTSKGITVSIVNAGTVMEDGKERVVRNLRAWYKPETKPEE